MRRVLICGLVLLVSSVANAAYLDVGGAKVWYEECGAEHSSGPGLVLLHDGLVHSITWNGVWAPLCAQYHVVRYDRRGYGRSDSPKALFAPDNDVYKVMRQVHMEHAVVVGNSSGGALALDFALSHPEMVTALFLIGPVVQGMASSDYFMERGRKNSEPLSHGDTKATAENWSKDRFLIAGDDAAARKQLYDALAENPQNLNYSGTFEQRLSGQPSLQRLSQIRVPTLVLVGEADIADVFAHSGAIEAGVPLASFEVWKDTGHLIQIQRPAELAARLTRFVSLATRKEVDLPARTLASYAGQYTCFDRPATVTVHAQRLVFQLPGDASYYLFAASETKFFLRTDEAEVAFEKDASGKVAAMVVHNPNGSSFRCARAAGLSGPSAKE